MPESRSHAEILRAIERFERGPVREQLAALLGVQFKRQALQRFADKYPDRHAQAVAILMRWAGYAEAPAVSLHLTAKLDGLSDSQILAELRSRLSALGLGTPALLPGVVVEAESADTNAECRTTKLTDSST